MLHRCGFVALVESSRVSKVYEVRVSESRDDPPPTLVGYVAIATHSPLPPNRFVHVRNGDHEPGVGFAVPRTFGLESGRRTDDDTS